MTDLILVAPTEPKQLKARGTSSSLPERHGVDFLWPMRDGELGGVQRKEVSDLVASLNDGRLSKEVGQMEGLAFKGLVVEDGGRWTSDGWLMSRYVKFHKSALVGVVLTAQSKGVMAWQTRSLEETWEAIEWMRKWSLKPSHSGLSGRERPAQSRWGKVSNRNYAIYLLTSLPGVGSKTANAVLDHFGKVPMAWTVTAEELMQVAGIGKVTAERMIGVLDA